MAVPARPVDGQPIDPVWGGVVHDTIVAQDVLFGSGSLVFSASSLSGALAVVFPHAFAAVPIVVVTTYGGPHYTAGLTAYATASGFTVQGRRGDGSAQSVSIAFGWIALGQRA